MMFDCDIYLYKDKRLCIMGADKDLAAKIIKLGKKQSQSCKPGKSCENCPHSIDLVVTLWGALSEEFRVGSGFEKYLFPTLSKKTAGGNTGPAENGESNKSLKRPIPVLSLLFVPVETLHDHSEDLGIDPRVGILDHSIWHRALVLPQDLEKIRPTIDYMLADLRYQTIVAGEALLDLYDRFDYESRMRKKKFHEVHADTYKRRFVPRSRVRKDIEKLIKKFKHRQPAKNKNERKLILADDHLKKLRPIKFGKRDAVKRAIAEAIRPSSNWPTWDAEATGNAEDGGNKILSDSPPFRCWSCDEYESLGLPDFEKDNAMEKDGEKKLKSLWDDLVKGDWENPIILLDFLFSDDENANQTYFGTELVKRLAKKGSPVTTPVSVFFMSTFTWGVIEELKQGTTPLHTGNLFIDIGEDPVAYPEIFVKKLLQFMLSWEQRPFVRVKEALEQARARIFELVEEKKKDTPYPWIKVYHQIGILSVYMQEWEDLRKLTLLDKSDPLLDEFSNDAKDCIDEFYNTMGRFLHSGPEDCRIVNALVDRWLNREDFDKDEDKNLVKALIKLAVRMKRELKGHMSLF